MKRLAVVALVLLVCGCSRGPSPEEKREAALRLYYLETQVLDRTLAKKADVERSIKELTSVLANGREETAEDKKLMAESRKIHATLFERRKELEEMIAKRNAKVIEAKKALDALE